MSNISRGFSLIELLITIAIIGVLAALAYPAYDNYIMKSRRTGATTTLMEMAQKQEDFRSENNYYADDSELKGQMPGKEAYFVAEENRKEYDFSVTDASKSKFTLKAAIKKDGKQKADETCAEFYLTHTGQKTANNSDGKDTTKDCW